MFVQDWWDLSAAWWEWRLPVRCDRCSRCSMVQVSPVQPRYPAIKQSYRIAQSSPQLMTYLSRDKWPPVAITSPCDEHPRIWGAVVLERGKSDKYQDIRCICRSDQATKGSGRFYGALYPQCATKVPLYGSEASSQVRVARRLVVVVLLSVYTVQARLIRWRSRTFKWLHCSG